MTLIDEYMDYQTKYESIYGENAIVLMQVGGFYEWYNSNIDNSNTALFKVAGILEMVITKKNKNIKEVSLKNPWMGGFPIHSKEKQLNKLINNNFTVILIDQMTNEKKNVPREVTQIYSPGTYIENLNRIESNNLMCIYIEKMGKILDISISIVDISTGNVIIFEIIPKMDDFNYSIDELYRFIKIHNPREAIIYYENLELSEENFLESLIQFLTFAGIMLDCRLNNVPSTSINKLLIPSLCSFK